MAGQAEETATAAGDPLGAMLAQLRQMSAGHSGERRLPPIHLWNPESCGDIGMEIRADGSWWHEGGRIGRQPLVDLFASVLRKDEDGSTWLVTPHEKVVVHVADAHFLGVRADRLGSDDAQVIALSTNCGDVVRIGREHPLRVVTDPDTSEPRPYVLVRGRLEARVLRAPFYEMVQWAHERDGRLWLHSDGVDFNLGTLS